MPDKISYGRVEASDAKEIVANLVAGGKPIERLRIKKKD
ncbi:MAG: hypothetical protein BWY75_03259 [bacterium ADurb.Bin425]|jgi:(2Fe-2S) ferredoxin|nr:MAG: hypothetical protein BWY75_03259 [bacterium ADurb.Bin425]